ncbi:MAG: TfoX/Sxy family DNA transformation protein [Rubricella sp.]
MEAIRDIRNLGPAMEEAFARAGIASGDALRALGPDEAYARLIASGHRPHFIAYYALVLGLQDRGWNTLGAEEKAALRERFDAIKARPGASELESFLREMGLD